MKKYETFAEFKAEFVRLATLSETPRKSWVGDLYNKLNDRLKDSLAHVKYEWGTNFRRATERIQHTDNRQLLNIRQKKDARAVATYTSPSGALVTSASRTLPTRTASVSVPNRTYDSLYDPKPPRTNSRYITPVRGTTLTRDQSIPRPTPPPITDPNCRNCGKHGHWTRQCPEPQSIGIKAIGQEDLQVEEPFDDGTLDISDRSYDIDLDESGNEDA
jgi:hypothetical protein